MRKYVSLKHIVLVLCTAVLVFGIIYMWFPQVLGQNNSTLSLNTEDMYVPTIPKAATPPTEQADRVTTTEDEPDTSDTSTDNVVTPQPSTPVELPKAVNLPVPFTSQAPEGNWDQPWQDACEEAALIMLDAYYKEYSLSTRFVKDEIITMVDWETAQNWGHSIPIEQVKEQAKWYMGEHYKFDIIENPTVNKIKQYLATGYPVYVVAYGKSLDNPNFTNGGPEYHALIIRGYTETQFITNDPGTRNGKEFLYMYDNLMDSIRNWNNGDVLNGRRVVMVAEPI